MAFTLYIYVPIARTLGPCDAAMCIHEVRVEASNGGVYLEGKCAMEVSMQWKCEANSLLKPFDPCGLPYLCCDTYLPLGCTYHFIGRSV